MQQQSDFLGSFHSLFCVREWMNAAVIKCQRLLLGLRGHTDCVSGEGGVRANASMHLTGHSNDFFTRQPTGAASTEIDMHIAAPLTPPVVVGVQVEILNRNDILHPWSVTT